MDTPKKDWISPRVGIKETGADGKGMFALEKIFAGDTVVIFGGEYTDARGAVEMKKSGKIVMQWDDDLFSIEERGDDLGYFINHSCEPNTWMKDAFTITAMKDIAAGEEVTADYALWEADEDHTPAWECRCGSPRCRRKITGTDWKMSELQERYKNHFSPLLNKRIMKFHREA